MNWLGLFDGWIKSNGQVFVKREDITVPRGKIIREEDLRSSLRQRSKRDGRPGWNRTSNPQLRRRNSVISALIY